MLRLLTILLLSMATANAAIPIIFLRAGTNAVSVGETNLVETDILIVQAEDFNTEGGQYFPSNPAFGHSFNTVDLYSGTTGLRGSDYDIEPSAVELNYRDSTLTAMPPTLDSGWYPGLYTSSIFGWDLGPFDMIAQDWANYTRTFPTGQCRIFVRMAHANVAHSAYLSLVTSDRSLTNQTTQVIGHFTNSATGSFFTYASALLRTNSTTNFTFSGEQTVRLTMDTDDETQPVFNGLEFRVLESAATTTAFISVREGNAFVGNRNGMALRGNQ